MPSHGFQKYLGRFQLVFGKSSRFHRLPISSTATR
jgi:hypothetical protein